MHRSVTSVVATALALACSMSLYAAPAERGVERQTAPSTSSYAEGVYSEYAEASSNKVTFRVETLASGRLQALKGQTFESLIGMPTQVLKAGTAGFEFTEPHFESANVEAMSKSDLMSGVEGFAQVGLPLERGRYRHLAVVTKIRGDESLHEALEFCFSASNHCVLLDPSVEFVDSMVNDRRRAKAEGWGPREQFEAKTEKGACGLASNPANIGFSWTWAPWTRKYKNVYGMTLVTKNLGGQQTGVRCDAYCKPKPFGYSNSSSASGTLGWSATCDWDYNAGTSGGGGKYVAETKCTHKWSGSAKAIVTRQGSGTGVDLAWSVEGGVDANGGRYGDTCGYF